MHTHLTTDASPAENTIQASDGDTEKNADGARKSLRARDEMIVDDQRYSLLPPDMLQYVRKSMEKEKEKETIGTNRDQWIAVGRVIDRFFFVLWTIVMSVTAVVVLSVLPNLGQTG